MRYVFVNLGSDHPSLVEAFVKGQKEQKERFPKLITCLNEVRFTPDAQQSSLYDLIALTL